MPRAIAPDKADPGRFGNTWARAYGIAAPGNLTTNITLTQPGEMYLNFGLLGVLLGMPMIGVAYRVFYEILGRHREDPAILALYAVTAWLIVGSHENILAAGLFGSLKVALVLWVLLWGTAWLSPRLGKRTHALPSPATG